MRFFVDDFKQGTTGDDGAAIRKAIEAALESKKASEVVFGARKYRVAPLPDEVNFEMGSLFIRNGSNITLRGAGEATTLVFTNPLAGGVAFEKCRNVVIRDLQIDWEPVPYAFGTVVSVDEKGDSYDLELDSASMDFTHEAFTKARLQFAMTVKPDAEYGVTRYGPGVIQGVTMKHLTGRRWRVSKLSDVPAWFRPTITPGAGYVHLTRSYSGSGVCFSECTDARAERVDILSSPALCFYPTNNDGNISYLDCHVKVGKGRLISTNADGVHAPGNRGVLRIERCSFEGMADDAINVRGTTLLLNQVISPTEVAISRLNYEPKPGMKMIIYDGRTLKEKARVTVASADPVAALTRVRFTEPVEGMVGGSSFADGGRIYNLPESKTPFIVRNCHFKAFRGRGILASSIGGVIERNLFDNNEGWGIDLGFGERIWGEGPPPQNLLIANNRFAGMGGSLASITVRVSAGDPIDGPENLGKIVMRNLTIRDNRFENLTAPAIMLRGVAGVVLENNRLLGDRDKRRVTHYFFAGAATAVDVDYCSGVTVDGLKVQDPLYKLDMRVGSLVPAGKDGLVVKQTGLRIKDERIDTVGVTMGVIRWDAWFTDPFNPYADNLADKRWHGRLPFYAKVLSDTKVQIYGDTQKVVDQEIAYAKNGGVDYFVFPFHYPDVREDGFRHDKMIRARELYLASKHKDDVKFCMLDSPGHAYLLNKTDPRNPNDKRTQELIGLMKQPNYQTVVGGRPLLYLMFWNPDERLGGGTKVSFFDTAENGRGWLDALRKRVMEAGLPNPYLVALAQTPEGGASIATDGGLDAISAYTSWGGPDYAGLCAAHVRFWDAMKATGVKVIPNLSAGWGGPRDGSGDKLQPKPGEIAAHLQSALKWIDANPKSAEARTMLWYAWNEIDEGGWLIPDKGQGTAKLDETGRVMRAYRGAVGR